jgi:hypothetical protein
LSLPNVALTLPEPHPSVLFRALDGGAVLFSSADEVYFGLNEVGARVWELLPPAHTTLAEVCAELTRVYPDVERQVLLADVAELLGDLESHGLVVPARGAVQPSPFTDINGHAAPVDLQRVG